MNYEGGRRWRESFRPILQVALFFTLAFIKGMLTRVLPDDHIEDGDLFQLENGFGTSVLTEDFLPTNRFFNRE